jgi:(p)ppGpp synthase/HD superfamily hydrolase
MREHLFAKAADMATKFHKGQKRWGGEPYITHPIAVAEMCQEWDAKTVAMLHDIIEDTEATEELLRKHFPDEIVDAVVALTRGNNEDYGLYYRRVGGNRLATQVKMADLIHNMSTLTDGGKQGRAITRVRRERYQLALEYLRLLNAI